MDMIEYGYRKSKGYCYVSLIFFLINKIFFKILNMIKMV